MQNHSPDDATHLGWRHESSAADGDHLLIRSDLGADAAAADHPGEPLLQFNNETGPSSPEADEATAHPSAPASDAPVDDAAIDAPPYLWGGEALAPEPPVVFGSAPAQETVFS